MESKEGAIHEEIKAENNDFEVRKFVLHISLPADSLTLAQKRDESPKQNEEAQFELVRDFIEDPERTK